jgi:Ser/Thr protein kinase RdoA (MazF antagonist)
MLISERKLAAQKPPRLLSGDVIAVQRLFEINATLLFGAPIFIEQCDVANSYYKTYRKAASHHKESFFACHRVIVRDAFTNTVRTTFICTKTFRHGQSATAYAALKSLNVHAVHFPELETVAWPFQADVKLPHLRELLDAGRVRSHLPYQALPACFAGPEDIAGVDIDVVNYRPEIRCVARYTLHHISGDSACRFVLYAKTFAEECADNVFRRLDYLWHHAQANRSGLHVARLLALNALTRTVWTEAVPGVTLAEAMNSSNGEKQIAVAARALLELHSLRAPSVTDVVSRQYLLADAQKKCAKLRSISPLLADLLPMIARDLEAALVRLPREKVCLIHRDCHVRQFIAGANTNANTLTMLDFDELAYGDPIQDVANFMVDLQFHSLSSPRVKRLNKLFFTAYQTKAAQTIPIESLLWHAIVQLVNKAYRAYLRQSTALPLELAHVERLLKRDLQSLRTAVAMSGEISQ